MAVFTIQIADRVTEVTSLFESSRDYCRAYLTDAPPQLRLRVTREDLAFEQQELDREAVEEGLRLRRFSDPFLERAAIQRGIAEDLFDHGTLMLHGSVVAVDGAGYLFTAKCGTGKSTHTRLWREVFGDRAVMINDDKPFVTVRESGCVVSGAPWSGKHGLDTNLTVPLKGICILRRGSENRIRPITAQEALPMLLHQTYCPLAAETHARYRQLTGLLAQSTPLWEMECTKDAQAARVAHRAMSSAD